MELTDHARANLESYLARVEKLAGRDPRVDPAEVVAGVREHVAAALETREAAEPATAAELADVLERLGDPAGWIGEGRDAPVEPRDSWRAGMDRGVQRARRAAEHALVLLGLLWPLILAWSAAQPGGFLYAWVEGGTRWTEFRPPVYWARIAAVTAGMLGVWWLVVGILSLTPVGSSLRSRVRSLWSHDPAEALIIAGLVSSLIAALGGLL